MHDKVQNDQHMVIPSLAQSGFFSDSGYMVGPENLGVLDHLVKI